jgi:hypothetical protein
VRVAQGGAQLVVGLEDLGEAEQLVADVVALALGEQDVDEGVGVVLVAVAPRYSPTEVM